MHAGGFSGNNVSNGSIEFALGDYVPYLLHQAHYGIVRGFEADLRRFDIVLAEWRVTAVLAHHGRLRFGDLAQATGLEPPTLVRILKGMEGKHWVARQQSDVDRRATDITATPVGLALARSIVPLAEKAATVALQGFTEDELEFLRRLLKRIVQNISPGGAI